MILESIPDSVPSAVCYFGTQPTPVRRVNSHNFKGIIPRKYRHSRNSVKETPPL